MQVDMKMSFICTWHLALNTNHKNTGHRTHAQRSLPSPHLPCFICYIIVYLLPVFISLSLYMCVYLRTRHGHSTSPIPAPPVLPHRPRWACCQ